MVYQILYYYYNIYKLYGSRKRLFIVQAGTKYAHLSTKCCFCFELRFEYDFPSLIGSWVVNKLEAQGVDWWFRITNLCDNFWEAPRFIFACKCNAARRRQNKMATIENRQLPALVDMLIIENEMEPHRRSGRWGLLLYW